MALVSHTTLPAINALGHRLRFLAVVVPLPINTTAATAIHSGRGIRIEKRRGSGVTGSVAAMPSGYRRRAAE